MISNGLPVDCDAPCAVMLMLMALVFTPRPICLALTPPVPVAALAPLARCVVWLISDAKVMELYL